MNVPSEFKRFVRCFLQGSDDETKSEAAWINAAIQLNSKVQLRIVRQFLDDVLGKASDVNELQAIWQSGSPNFHVTDTHIRTFFEHISRQISENN